MLFSNQFAAPAGALRGLNTHLIPPQRKPSRDAAFGKITLPQVFAPGGGLTTILAPKTAPAILAMLRRGF
jgi:hypothetical protein